LIAQLIENIFFDENMGKSFLILQRCGYSPLGSASATPWFENISGVVIGAI